MNIMFTSDLSGMGGGETSLVNLCECLAENNKITVMCNCNGKLVSILNGIGIKTYVIDYRNKSRLFSNIKRIREIVKRERVEVIHSNDPLTSILMYISTAGLKRRNFWTCHGQWYNFGFIIKKLVMASNCHVFCVSSKVQESLIKMGFENTSVSFLGIPLGKYIEATESNIKQEYEISNDAFVIGSVGRFQPIKGQLKLVKAIDRLSREGYNVKCLLIGGCIYHNQEEEAYYNEIKNYVEFNKLDKIVIFIGERDDIPCIMKSIDLLVVPSDNESFGMVAVEALASELPVISTPNDGVSEILDYSPDFISKTNDADGLYSSILNYINNPSLKSKAIVFCRNKRDCYDVKAIARKYYDGFKDGVNK